MSDESRRGFLKKCGLAVLATAGYKVVSVMGVAEAASAPNETGCDEACISSCTGSTVPEPPPPTPAE